jgi:hypothetical protein
MPAAPNLDVANCDIKASCSVLANRNMKSSGNLGRFRFTASFS